MTSISDERRYIRQLRSLPDCSFWDIVTLFYLHVERLNPVTIYFTHWQNGAAYSTYVNLCSWNSIFRLDSRVQLLHSYGQLWLEGRDLLSAVADVVLWNNVPTQHNTRLGIFQDLEHGGVSTNPWGSLLFPSSLPFPFLSLPFPSLHPFPSPPLEVRPLKSS